MQNAPKYFHKVNDESIITTIFRKVNDGHVIYGEILAESFGFARFIVNQLLISRNVSR